MLMRDYELKRGNGNILRKVGGTKKGRKVGRMYK